MAKLKAYRGLFFALFVTGIVAIGATFFARPVIIYNATNSLPHGLYLVVRKPVYERGDLVVFPIPESVKGLVRQRHWLPDGAFLIKPIAGKNGDMLSTKSGRCLLNGVDFGMVETVDRTGQPLPVFSINRRLENGEIAVVNPTPHSFDSRYFGPISERQIIGKVVPIWTQSGTARNVRKPFVEGSRQKTGEVRKGGEIGSAR
ncbi:MAG TPA: S26 family signal peptidase [Sulfuricurvum sp.]|nr:S26 family signal peptidase [Sulfuricurvum sp.]